MIKKVKRSQNNHIFSILHWFKNDIPFKNTWKKNCHPWIFQKINNNVLHVYWIDYSGCVSMDSMGSAKPMEFWRRVPELNDFEQTVWQKSMNLAIKCKMRSILHFFSILRWHLPLSFEETFRRPMDFKS